MRQIYLPLVASLLLAAPAFAAITPEGVMSTFSAEGYTDIEVRSGADTIKVEATRNGQRVEVIYDSTTGDVVKSEAHALDGTAPAGNGPGSGSDDGASASDDDSGHHNGNDDSHDDDSSGDDSHDGSGHDRGDDHGGDHGDDHGSDDSDDDSNSGSDDSGSRS
ncbi:hypothetical protein [Phaeovulum sp. W22_SRMD_FR3]|uniref:hypothetical protein n=1 Tax=Phaeovulum sp. W22_SRMD_FR3 TaxID=3240274 RepID=UPI003F94CC90